jgi:ankyrin repeat protein
LYYDSQIKGQWVLDTKFTPEKPGWVAFFVTAGEVPMGEAWEVFVWEVQGEEVAWKETGAAMKLRNRKLTVVELSWAEVATLQKMSLVEAAKAGNAAALRVWLRAPVGKDKLDTALQVTSHGKLVRDGDKHWECIDLLVAAGANGKYYTPLMVAAKAGDVRVLRERLSMPEGKAELDAKYKGHTALELASHGNHQKCIDLLVATHYTPLMVAAKAGDVIGLRARVSTPEGKAELDAKYDGDTALHYASQGKHWECIDLLVEAGATGEYYTRLMEVAKAGDVAALRTRLSTVEGKAEINVKYDGDTALHYASQGEHWECIDLLRTMGVTGVIYSVPNETPLMGAAKAGDVAALWERLKTKEGKAEVDAKYKGHTALELASKGKHWECGCLLVEAGAQGQYTYVEFAAMAGDAVKLRARLSTPEGKTELDADDDGVAITRAATSGHTACVEALLAAGATKGLTPALLEAARTGRTSCVLALLSTRSARAFDKCDGRWVLHPDDIDEDPHIVAYRWASKNGHVCVSRFLAESLPSRCPEHDDWDIKIFDLAALAEVKQNELTYEDEDGNRISLGGEQGTILINADVALASAPAGCQGRFWGPGPGGPGDFTPSLPLEAYDPPLADPSRCPYYFQFNIGPGRSILTVWIPDIDKCSDLDWFGHWTDNVERARLHGQRMLCLYWPPAEVIATYGDNAETTPFLDSEEAAEVAAIILDKRLTDDKSHTMPHRLLTSTELEASDHGFFNPLCWGYAQLQEMRFILQYYPELVDIKAADEVVLGDAGDVETTPWAFMMGELKKKGGGKRGRSKKWKVRLFELGKNELRYKAGMGKAGKWQTIDLSAGTVMSGSGCDMVASGKKVEAEAIRRKARGLSPKSDFGWGDSRDIQFAVAIDESKRPGDITLVDANKRTWELQASHMESNNWAVAIEKHTSCKGVGKNADGRWYGRAWNDEDDSD